MKQLDTQQWNLGTATLLAVASLGALACGPAVEFDEDTDGDSAEGTDTIIDPSSPTGPTDPTDPTSGDCEIDGCPEGFYCGPEGQCIEDYDCYDYGCYCVYGHCSPGYDCYDDDECGVGELCETYNGCNVLQGLSDCGSPAMLEGTPLVIPTGDPIRKLAFVDLDPQTPGEDLIVGTDVDGWLLPSGGEAVALPAQGALLGAVSTDLDGDGLTDLALIDLGGLAVIYGFGAPSEEFVRISSAPFDDLHVLRDVEGLPTLIVQDSFGAVFMAPGTPDRTVALLATALALESGTPIDAYAIGDGSDDLLHDSPNEAGLYDLDEGTSTAVAWPRRPHRGMTVASLTGSERSDIVWMSQYPDWSLLEISLGGVSDLQFRAIYFDYSATASGDLDGNGNDDLLAIGAGGLVVMPGDSKWGLTCFSQAPFDGGLERMVAIGDLDADGIDEAVVVVDTSGPPVQYDISWSP